MKKNTIAIVAGGKLDKQILKEISRADFVIGVDRGAAWLLAHQVVLDVAIGDFDSVSRAELLEIKSRVPSVKEYPSEKDKTDLELAIDHAIKLHPKTVLLFGVFGTRMDHSLVSIPLLEKFLRRHIACWIIDTHNTATLTRGTLRFSKGVHRYVSVISYSDSAMVTLEGFRYPLKRHVLRRATSLGISNELTGSYGLIRVHSGIILVTQSSDETE